MNAAGTLRQEIQELSEQDNNLRKRHNAMVFAGSGRLDGDEIGVIHKQWMTARQELAKKREQYERMIGK